MKAWLLTKACDLNTEKTPLVMSSLAEPAPSDQEVLVRIRCCGVCHTELDEIEGRTQPPIYPVIPGHQVVGIIETCGKEVKRHAVGDRVGVAWIYSACGHCAYCLNGQENLCAQFRATGRDANGGYAEFMTVDENFAYRIPDAIGDVKAAPLLCAGAIGYRSLELANLCNGEPLGLTGFGASGHLVLMMTHHLYPDSPVYVFARSREEQDFAKSLGAAWAGTIADSPPDWCGAIIDTTPVWSSVTGSLAHLAPGRRLIINAIRKEPGDQKALLDLRYEDHLWMEKEIKSVANIARRDVEEFLALAARIPIEPEVETYPFESANRALLDMKQKHVKGAKVLLI